MRLNDGSRRSGAFELRVPHPPVIQDLGGTEAAMSSPLGSTLGPFRIWTCQQNLGYFLINPETSIGIFSPFNGRAKLQTLLESSAHAPALRGKTDEKKMLLRAEARC